MSAQIRRRDFITLLGPVVWPLAARAQAPAMPTIGFLGALTRAGYAQNVVALHRGLKETGYVQGQNLAVIERWADNQYERLPALAAELIALRVAVIVTIGGAPAAKAAKAATSTIPIVFHMGGDPVELGIVASLNRPGGNITGATIMGVALEANRLKLLHEVVPTAKLIGLLVNPTNAQTKGLTLEVQEAARVLGQQILVLEGSTERDIDAAFAIFVDRKIGGLLIGADAVLAQHSPQIAALALRHKIPTMIQNPQFVDHGGLMSYSSDIADVYRQAGNYVGRVPKGEKPADLPVTQPTKFELVINLKTAKALGLEVPTSLLARADEVIE